MKHIAVLALLGLAGCYFPTHEEEHYVSGPQGPPRTAAKINFDHRDPMARSDVEKLVKAGVSDAVILEKAKKSGMVKLGTDDIIAIKQSGASDALIKELITTEQRVSVPQEMYTPSTATTVYRHTYYTAPSVYLGYSWGWPGYYSCWPRSYYGGYRCGPRFGVRIGW